MRSGPSLDELDILVVEDNPTDVFMIEMVLREFGFTKKPTVLDDGEPAIAMLGRGKEYLPDLVILDLNLKRVDGAAVLAYIRQTPELQGVFVAVLSSSPTDLMFRRAGQADCYFSKPSDLEGFQDLGRSLRQGYRQRALDRATE